MEIDIKKESGYWTLYVDGIAMIQRESYQVVDNVAYALRHPGDLWPSEADEVAVAIRRWKALLPAVE